MIDVLVTLTKNPAEEKALQEYKKRAKAIRDEYGAKTILRLDVKEKLIGSFKDESIRVLRFPSVNHVQQWLSDPRYKEVISLRERGYHNVTLSILKEPHVA